jgi:hypothetical protein
VGEFLGFLSDLLLFKHVIMPMLPKVKGYITLVKNKKTLVKSGDKRKRKREISVYGIMATEFGGGGGCSECGELSQDHFIACRLCTKRRCFWFHN